MFELLKIHLYLGVSAIAKIDLYDYTKAFQWSFQATLCLMYIAAISSGPGHSLRSRRLLRFALVMIPQGLLWI